MAGHGAVTGTHPSRKPANQRRNRNPQVQLQELPTEGYVGPFPSLPTSWVDTVKGERVTTKFLASTRAWFLTWARSPMACEFTDVDWQRLHLIAVLVDQNARAPRIPLMVEIRLQEGCFGGTPMDRRRLGVAIAKSTTGERPQAPASVRRLRAVDPESA